MFFNVSEGGLASIGGIVGSTFFVFTYLKLQRMDVGRYMDALVPSLCLGIVLTRIGCFFNGCCYGIASNLPWAVNVGDFPRHPTQLYHSLSGLILFMVIWHLRKRERYAGNLFPVFLVLYGPIRFLIEFLRDSRRYLLDLTAAQLFILPLILMGMYFLFKPKSMGTRLHQG
jgi:phosphatidylglycerol---prolipoprotein diacylglyceryl transferase